MGGCSYRYTIQYIDRLIFLLILFPLLLPSSSALSTSFSSPLFQLKSPFVRYSFSSNSRIMSLQESCTRRGGSAVEQQSISKHPQNKDGIEAKERNNLSIRSNVGQLSIGQHILVLWGLVNVLAFIGSAFFRLLPVALEPIYKNDLSFIQSLVCALWVAVMSYVEGYKSFHLKFSPLVVKRAFISAERPSLIKGILAGPYAMGLFGASRKRVIVSWSIVGGVVMLVKLVKMLEYPWRGIIDSGVIAGLSIGMLSILWHYIQGIWNGHLPDIDPCLPENEHKS